MQPHPLHAHCYYTPKNLCFYQIPKNASTIIRLWAAGPPGGDWSQTFNISDLTAEDKVIVVLRDPVERYISAANMYLRLDNTMFPHAAPAWNTYMTEDKHFAKQSWYLDQAGILDRNNVDYFWFCDDVVQHMIDHYNLDQDNKIENKTDEPIIRTVYEAPLREYYADDYELIANTTFINR